jgi:hypothetical protein
MWSETSPERTAYRHAVAYLPLKECLVSMCTRMCAASAYVVGSSSLEDCPSDGADRGCARVGRGGLFYVNTPAFVSVR